jgi:hypothetical protein
MNKADKFIDSQCHFRAIAATFGTFSAKPVIECLPQHCGERMLVALKKYSNVESVPED